MPDEHETVTGRCFVCKRVFTYDPDEVTTFLIDPETGLPPGFGVLGTMRPAGPEAVARSADQPLCPGCQAGAERYRDSMNPPPPSWEIWPPTGN
ncbi:hypothetical protein FAF44_29490 [Nonomuraea sp. MG754425]|uniref:hypothetical protein n=1 Tax=Nonomuraea sp. MG754425 TaxID=2570319 RepID=UPI001F26CF7D|nr:hypothetical protein [Nonomuraea sp. MG754425]MCF6472498.1 hypothetical protein [Nonomuraea sp. MG754425]